ncbi:UNVERIFIED_CONTAM: hypothetical protein FKN15_005385 [Acipenser sinensis]
MASDGTAKLSKNVLRMKFMQRGLDAETRKQLEEEEKRIISDEHWYLDLPELKEKEYESLVGSIKRKFTKKRNRPAIQGEDNVNSNIRSPKIKKVFLKPQD